MEKEKSNAGLLIGLVVMVGSVFIAFILVMAKYSSPGATEKIYTLQEVNKIAKQEFTSGFSNGYLYGSQSADIAWYNYYHKVLNLHPTDGALDSIYIKTYKRRDETFQDALKWFYGDSIARWQNTP